MYRVLVVDDEPPFVRQILQLIQRVSHRFAVAATAYNGADALSILRETAFDLIITDVKMPGMNGIELIREARSLYPGIACVIISGYADFEYAQSAIKAGVCDYVLKPIELRQFSATLTEVEKRLERQAEARRAAMVDAILLPESSWNSAYGTVPCQGAVVLSGWFGKSSYLQMPPTAYLQQTGVLQAVFEDSGACREACVEGLGGNVWFVLLVDPQPDVPRLAAKRAQLLSLNWTLAFSAVFGRLEDIAPTLHISLKALKDSARLHGVTLVDDPAEAPVLDPQWMIRLETLAKAASGSAFLASFESILTQLWEKNVRQADALLVLTQAVRFLNVRFGPEFRLEEAFGDACSEAVSFDELCRALRTLLEEGFGRDDPQAKSGRDWMDKISRFVEERLQGSITLTDACDHLHVSQPLISRVVRELTGKTFNEYVTTRRMERAVRLMREEPTLMTREIAAGVGYEDAHYFCRVFKTIMNQTPTKYRENL